MGHIALLTEQTFLWPGNLNTDFFFKASFQIIGPLGELYTLAISVKHSPAF